MKTIVVIGSLMILSRGAFPQTQAARPELKALEKYLGSWTNDGEDKTPVTGGRVTCTSTRRWISGGFFVESHRDCKTPRGDFSQVEVFGYDFEKRVYVYWGFIGRVVSTYTAPTMDEGAISWTGIGASSGNRCTEVFVSAASSTDQCETATDGGKSWILRSGGKSTKAIER